jgi:pentatricopeptide repeat protein
MLVRDLMEEDEVEPDIVTYSTLISICERCGRLASVPRFKEEMKEQGVAPNVYFYNALMTCLRAQTQDEADWRKKEVYVQQAFELLNDDIPRYGLRPDLVTINALLGVLMAANKWQDSLNVLGEMEAKYFLKGDVITYSTCISACNRARQWEHVEGVQDKMKGAGIAGNVITYNALISSAARQGYVERAFELWDEMLAQGLAPNVVTYSALIAACQHGDRWVKAFEILLDMVQVC